MRTRTHAHVRTHARTHARNLFGLGSNRDTAGGYPTPYSLRIVTKDSFCYTRSMNDYENDDDEFEVPSNVPARGKTADALVETQGLSDEHNPVPVTQKDLESLQVSDLQRIEFVAKMRDCDLYLRNIHSLFPHAVTINGVLKLVAAGIQVHKHRSQIMKEICSIPEPTTGLDTVEFDNMGNIIKKA